MSTSKLSKFLLLTCSCFIIIITAVVGIILLSNLNEPKSTTFYVIIPNYTPIKDTITIHIEDKVYAMEQINTYEYKYTLDTNNIERGRATRYGYSRGGFSIFGEDTFIGNVGSRTFDPRKDTEIHDNVNNWKWISSEPIQVNVVSEVDSTIISKRSNFWAGPNLIDFWNPYFPLQYDSTITHLQDKGYNWVQIDPPWDYESTDPIIISNEKINVPMWPDQELREEIRIFKNNGFKIFLGPQICCTAMTYSNRSEEWWNQWFDQYENFIIHFANLGKEEGIDAMTISAPSESLPGNPDSPGNAKQRWDNIWSIARTSNAKLGFSYHVLNPDSNPQLLWPQEASTFFNYVDFLSVSMWNPVSEKESPSQDEINAGIEKLFRDLDYVYNYSQKPIVLAQVAYQSRKGAALEKGPEDSFTWDDPDLHSNIYDANIQAMIFEGLMRQIAKRSHITGIFPFGYWYVDAPLTVDLSIRAKPSEEIFSNWTKKIKENIK